MTDPLGSSRNYRFATILGAARLVGVDQPGGAGCAAASSAVEYDTNGNVKSRTNFNGVKTTYVYDTVRNLELSRTEAAGTTLARTTTTEWHPSFRLPKRIAEPKRIITYTYSASGSLESRTIQPTNDSTGAQGFGATVTNAAVLIRSSYTYDANGLPLTAVEPSVNGSPVMNVTYTWSQGNLVSAKNAAGHVTSYGNHDANGKPRSVTAPNGVVTTLAYHPRGWIESATTTAGGVTRQTRYQYEPTGKLKRVTLPDQSFVTFSYDEAQRLNGVTDSAGNTITYQLDNAGNRIAEKTTDPTGALTRQVTRIYDALNRLQTVTGDQQ